jgi:uncharacterized caspase-like protein
MMVGTFRALPMLLMLAALLLAEPAYAQKRIALVVGNQSYPSSPLVNTRQDARTVAAALVRVNFELIGGGPKFDLSRDQIIDAVQELADALAAEKGNAVGFFYYSGHGASDGPLDRRENYLIPINLDLSKSGALSLRSASLPALLDVLKSAGAKAVYVAIDACRNTLTLPTDQKGGGAGEKGLVRIRSVESLLLASATPEGHTAPDDGKYAAALARALQQPGISAKDAFDEAKYEVAKTRADGREPVVHDMTPPSRFWKFCFAECSPSPEPGEASLAFDATDRVQMARITKSVCTAVAFGRVVCSQVSGAAGPWVWPMQGAVAGTFGQERTRPDGSKVIHNGLDIAGAEGAQVVAAFSGQVLQVSSFRNTGVQVIVLGAEGGLAAKYLNLESAVVKPGQAIEAGDPIGRIGGGNTSAPILHFEVREKAFPPSDVSASWTLSNAGIDPLKFLTAR